MRPKQDGDAPPEGTRHEPAEYTRMFLAHVPTHLHELLRQQKESRRRAGTPATYCELVAEALEDWKRKLEQAETTNPPSVSAAGGVEDHR